ncbi:MAG: hypothetical protein HKO64_11695 [Xanthomonadales bacterium]|nr:hypothetical protein [Gammaproteobacteria bacterium]NNE05442.1 hypothetical protein [Xanthomonadales bacterium]NNL96275.1 hypothetical protein [Xanthomonadales bacterium]
MKKLLLIVFPLALSSLAAWYFYQRAADIPATGPHTTAVDETLAEASFVDQEFDGTDEELDGEVSRQWASGPAAKRVVEVPPNDAAGQADDNRFDDIRNIGDDELAAFTDYNLQKALDGDLNAANRVVHAHRRCVKAPKTPAQVDQQVQRTMRRLQWAVENRNSNREYPSEAEIRERYSQQYDNCRFTDELFNTDLRRQLEDMASRGHVTARYLFALWPPEIFGKADAFLAQQEWAEKALAYTLANLTEGETAGLLAFGQSYANNGTFTARDRYLGTAFIMAALDCGLDLEYYASYIERFLNSDQFRRDMADDPRAEVLVMADGLRTFCR